MASQDNTLLSNKPNTLQTSTLETLFSSIKLNDYVSNTKSNKVKDISSLSFLVKKELSHSDCIKLGTGLEKVLRDICSKSTKFINIKPKNCKGQKEMDHLFISNNNSNNDNDNDNDNNDNDNNDNNDNNNDNNSNNSNNDNNDANNDNNDNNSNNDAKKIIIYAEFKSNINLDTEKSKATTNKILSIIDELKIKYPEYEVNGYLVSARYYDTKLIPSLFINKYETIKKNVIGINNYLQLFGNHTFTDEQNYTDWVNELANTMFED